MSYYNNNGYDNQNTTNDYYNNHPQQYQSTYQPYNEVTHPPSGEHVPEDGSKGLLGALSGGIGGGILGKQTNHGFLGGVGGALVGSLAEDFLKKRSRPSSPQPPTNNTTVATATATATANANTYNYGSTPLATPVSPPTYHPTHVAPAYPATGQTSTSTTTVNSTSYFQQPPPCHGSAHPCAGTIHHCWSTHIHASAPQHGHGWSHWHK